MSPIRWILQDVTVEQIVLTYEDLGYYGRLFIAHKSGGRFLQQSFHLKKVCDEFMLLTASFMKPCLLIAKLWN